MKIDTSPSHSDDEIERAAVLRLALPHVEFITAMLSDPVRAERWLEYFGMSDEAARGLLFAPLFGREKKVRRGPKKNFVEAINRPARLRMYGGLLKMMRAIHRLIPKGVTETTDLRQVVDPWIADEILEHIADYRRQRARRQGTRSFEHRAAMMVYGREDSRCQTDADRAIRRLRNDQKAERKTHE